MKQYFIGLPDADYLHQIPISAEAFAHIHHARAYLQAAVAWDAQYRIMMMNFEDWADTAASWSADCAVASSVQQSRQQMCRLQQRVLNVLFGTRLYKERLTAIWKPVLAESIFTQLEKPFKQYEIDHRAFRMATALQNHVQKYGLSLATLALSTAETAPALRVWLNKQALADSGVFKEDVLAQMRPQEDLLALLAEYQQVLQQIQQAGESMAWMQQAQADAQQCLQRYQNLFTETTQCHSHPIIQVFSQEEGKIAACQPLFVPGSAALVSENQQ